MHESFLHSTETLKEEMERFNDIKIKGLPRWLAKREKLQGISSIAPHQRYGSIVFAVANTQEQQMLLARKQISVAGRIAYVAKFHESTPTTQCTSCYRLGHARKICKSKGCKLCLGQHYTKDHAGCKDCKTTGRLCAHQKPTCVNCKQEHPATSKDCLHRQSRATRAASNTPLSTSS